MMIRSSKIMKKEMIRIKGARENNLKNIDVEIPLGVFTCITGVSGSGKSSLVNQILYKRLAKELNRANCFTTSRQAPQLSGLFGPGDIIIPRRIPLSICFDSHFSET